MTKPALDNQLVEELLRGLRQRTREELTQGLMLLGGYRTPEMMRALQLLAAEHSAEPQEK
ncbi:hypothetical protein [Bradyrhizobium sp. RD5-C2]|uniref:hypothetical protein n=1 Tax=Bradyrhizobium sp. RD5-C2 TaxID=244562 RepID=UPI001CC6CD53|nr:hypothetical protein [Bradyrhizobium sp. RD5-C2]GIQ75500.1 hypothetical protein BraRD5C2_39410 [Bradyrhizobium sp. RD5-C2]